jgi:hypothetical protein
MDELLKLMGELLDRFDFQYQALTLELTFFLDDEIMKLTGASVY